MTLPNFRLDQQTALVTGAAIIGDEDGFQL